jgi:hypothetical protein
MMMELLRVPDTAEMAWELVDFSLASADRPIAVGGSVAPHRLLEAYRHAAFPFPGTGDYAVAVNRALYSNLTLTRTSAKARSQLVTQGCRLRRCRRRLRDRCTRSAGMTGRCGGLHHVTAYGSAPAAVGNSATSPSSHLAHR